MEMLVKTTDSYTGLLHHIGNADAFETKFAKPLGRNPYDPSVCLCLISFRITHLSTPLLPEPAGFAPICPHFLVMSPATSPNNYESIIVIYTTQMHPASFWVHNVHLDR